MHNVLNNNDNTLSSPRLIWSCTTSRNFVFGKINDTVFDVRAIYSMLSTGQKVMDICPIDGKIAIGGMAKRLNVFNATKFKANDIEIRSFSHNIYGTVNRLAWHPTKGNCLAFCTEDGAVGILDPNNPSHDPLVFPFCTRSPIHQIAWGYMADANGVQQCVLIVCADNKLMYYKDDKMDRQPGKSFLFIRLTIFTSCLESVCLIVRHCGLD